MKTTTGVTGCKFNAEEDFERHFVRFIELREFMIFKNYI